MTIVPSADLIRRTIDAEASYALSRMRVLERIDGNPIGIAYRRAGKHGWARAATRLPVAAFNTVTGLQEGDEADLEGVAAMVLRQGREAAVRDRAVAGRPEARCAR